MNINIDAYGIVILGDFNARTGEKEDFFLFENNIPELEAYEHILNDNCPKRVSCDKVVNKSGPELLDFCKSYSLPILNGRMGADKHAGEFTFIGPLGNSVIDYAICGEDLCKGISHFKVGDRTESSHFPIIISFDLRKLENVNRVDREYKKISTRHCFDALNIDRYRLPVQNYLTAGKMNEIINDISSIESNIKSIIEKYQKILTDSGECCRKTYINKQSKHKPWFDERCRQLKVDKSKLLKKYRNTRSINDLYNYKQARLEFKKQCRLSKANYSCDKLESLIESYKIPKTFWRKLKLLSKKCIREKQYNSGTMEKLFRTIISV